MEDVEECEGILIKKHARFVGLTKLAVRLSYTADTKFFLLG